MDEWAKGRHGEEGRGDAESSDAETLCCNLFRSPLRPFTHSHFLSPPRVPPLSPSPIRALLAIIPIRGLNAKHHDCCD